MNIELSSHTISDNNLGGFFMDKSKDESLLEELINMGLNISDQEIAGGLGITLEEVRNAKKKNINYNDTSSPVVTGWWSNNWHNPQ